VTTALERDPDYVRTWARQLAENDPELLEAFAPASGVPQEGLYRWLKAAAAEATVPADLYHGLLQAFADNFRKWASGEGWRWVSYRLRRKSAANDGLRRLLLLTWRKKTEEFQSVLRAVQGIPVAENLRQRMAAFLGGGDCPGLVLEP